MDLDLKVNGVSFKLGEPLDAHKLEQARCKKAGFFARKAVGLQSGEIAYRSRNCDITCFGGRFEIRPDSDSSRGLDQTSATSSHLIFKRGVLSRVQFQQFGSIAPARNAQIRFREQCEEVKGWKMHPPELAPINTYEDAESVVSCELRPGGDNAYFIWALKE